MRKHALTSEETAEGIRDFRYEAYPTIQVKRTASLDDRFPTAQVRLVRFCVVVLRCRLSLAATAGAVCDH